MNKRNLAIKISKHPLLKKLTEDKTIPNSVLAHLIVEELMEAPRGEFYVGKKGSPGLRVRNNIKQIMDNAVKSGDVKAITAASKRISNFPETFNIEGVSEEHLEILKKFSAHTVSRGAEQVKILQAAEQAKQTPGAEDDKKIQQAQQELDQQDTAAVQKVDQALKNSTEQSTQVDTKNLIPAIADVIIDMGKQQDYISNYQKNPTAAMDFILTKTPEEQVDVLKTAPPETQQKVVKAVADELEKDQQENPFKDLEGYSELNLKPPEEKVFVQFLTKLQQAKIINEENLVQLSKIIGTGRGLSKIIKGFDKPERKLLIVVLQRAEVQKFIQNNVQQIEKPQEPGKEEKPSTPMKGKPVAIKPEQAQKFVGAANNLINDFYNKKYRKEQADLVGEVITAMKEFVEDQDLALAFGKPPADKPTPEKAPEEQEATPEKSPEEQATEPLKEQEDEKVDADKNEMRSIRISLRSFLTRVNKTKKFLSEFEEVAGAGSVLSDSYKKRFMDNLQKIQSSIKKIANVLVKIIGSKEKINEREESDVMKKWKQVQKAYDEALKATSSVKELLDTSTPPDELDSFLTNDAYSALIDLAGHFPSVAPFGAGKMKRSDFEEYKVKFDTAIGQVKSDLQNVFNLMKTGEAASSALNDARDGLRDFADAIASIFGVPSQFEDAKVKPGDDEQPAVQEDPDKEPEEEKYSDEISEEDKELITAAIEDHKEFYKKASEELQKIEKERESTRISRDVKPTDAGDVDLSSLQELMKRTEDVIRSLNKSRDVVKGFMKRVESGDASERFYQQYRETLISYIKEYKQLRNVVRTGDYSSVLDTAEKRLGKIRKLLNRAKKYAEEKQAIYVLFESVLKNKYVNSEGKKYEPTMEELHKALSDADGGEAERLTGDMKFKIDRAAGNIENIFTGQMDVDKVDFSGFKKLVGFVADKVSKASIKLRSKINEEEGDTATEPTDQDRERAADEALLTQYKKDYNKMLKHMKLFVSIYKVFLAAMQKEQENQVETLESLDKNFTTVEQMLSLMDKKLKEVADIFQLNDITVTYMKEYGFPPEGAKKPEEGDDMSDIDPEDLEDIEGPKFKKMKERFKLGEIYKKSGMDQAQLVIYAKFLLELARETIVKINELVKFNRGPTRKQKRLVIGQVKKVMQRLKPEEQDELEKILKLKGVVNHLNSVYNNDFKPLDDDPKSEPPKKQKPDWRSMRKSKKGKPEKEKPEKEKRKPPTQADMQRSFYQQDRMFREQLIADKLKPLIREMLTKGK
jgi:hypothetical protein